jgi:hypothetical protein
MKLCATPEGCSIYGLKLLGVMMKVHTTTSRGLTQRFGSQPATRLQQAELCSITAAQHNLPA